MQFIDIFNYYPVQVNKLRYKNDSDHLTRVLTSNTRGTADTTKVGGTPIVVHKDPEEKHLLKLLALVSNKLYERFATLKHAFRYLDTDHTQQITLNEFAQAVEYLRLKISFDDIRKLF